MRVWSLAEARRVSAVAGQNGGTACAAFLADGVTLVTGGEDRRLRYWDVRTGKQPREERPGFAPKSLASSGDHVAASREEVSALSPDGLVRADARESGRIQLLHLPTKDLLLTLPGHGPALAATALAFSPDGRRLASGSADTTVLVWDLQGVLA